MGKKVSVDRLIFDVFVYLKSQSVNYFKNRKAIVEANKKERWKTYSHTCLWMIWKCIRRVIKLEHLPDDSTVIVQASNDTGACYGVAKCAKIIFGREKIVKVVIKRFASAELTK